MNNESVREVIYSLDICGITTKSFDEPETSAYLLWSISISFLLLLVVFFFGFLTRSRIRKKDPRVEERIIRKELFLQKFGVSYGYANSPKGYIDTWRGIEFPQLIEPLVQGSQKQRAKDARMVYLDYAGAALPTKSQLTAIMSDNTILANPHSTGPAASKTSLLIEQATKRVTEHFNCEPGRFAGLTNVPVSCDPKELHPGYETVFTSGATEALRIVAERFPWTTCQACGSSSTLVYANNSHTSVVGMRGPALASGARFECRSLRDIGKQSVELVVDEKELQCQCQHHNLLVVSAECNFGGDRPDIKSMVRRCRKNSIHTMIDFSKAASTSVVDLKECDPDFACLSFYKLFGEPTGLGVLFVRRSAINTLMRENDQPRYFGGGSVDVILPSIDFKVSRQQPTLLASLKNGTVHYRGISTLTHGFDELRSLGGMAKVKNHSTCLASEFVRRLRKLRHGNGQSAILIYGAWSVDEEQDKGPTVPFNCLRSDGSFVGYNEVSKLAELHEPPMQLRTGCFCNPGACQEALGLKDEDLQANYYTNGHVCGDHIDAFGGKPTGTIRASFGKDSLWEDMDCLLSFLEGSFINAHTSESQDDTLGLPNTIHAVVTELYIFPIKSCAAQRVENWSLDKESGRLDFDREFALVDSSGTAMRLQRYSKMSQIRPRVDIQSMTLIVSAPGYDDLVLNLVDEASDVKPNGVIQVCGNKCGGRLWGSYESSKWFSNYLGVQCWLARHFKDSTSLDIHKPSHAAFANEESILLISQNAVDRLNLVLERQGQKHAQTKHFRPNIVVSNSSENPTSWESGWKVVQHSDSELAFETAGDCARCSMVDVDPTTGIKGKTLRALADHNRRNGRITFGIFLRQTESPSSSVNVISEGDVLVCK